VQAQPSLYFQAVTNLHPVGYWPMHEVEAPAPGNIETNYGTLGALGNGYYNDWTTLPGANARIIRQVPGPVVSPPDTGTYFTNSAGRQTTAGCLLIPNVSSSLSLSPPFTIEGWAEASVQQVGTFSTIMGQGGGAGLNGSPSFSGWSLNWNNPGGNSGAIYNMYAWGGPGSGMISGCANAPSTLVTSNTWYYFAYVFTTNNTSSCIVNGSINASGTQLNPPLPPTTWSPVFLGNGRNGNTGPAGFSFDGALAEVAIYTNALSAEDLSAHYNAGISASPPTNYFELVTSYNPLIYLRMNAPAYTPPAVGTWPALANYGTVPANGVYTPGTLPGFLSGAPASGYPVNVGQPVPLLSGMGTFADAGNDSSYNPTGASATFSVSAMFRGNPADPRTQSIVGHGTNSWMLGLTTSGRVVFNSGTNSAAATATGTAVGDLVGTATNNDGFWHYVVAVHNLTTNYLYVDGLPVGTNVSTAIIPGNVQHVMIGADPSFTNVNDNLGRQFSGQVCEVAVFTNALAASDVQTLYSALGVIPVIIQQPVSATVNAGGGFTSSVVVRGSPTLAYRWYFNTSSNYSGATAMTNTLDGRILGTATAALMFTNVHGSDAGYYFVVATNNYGALTSSVVSLAVNTSPTITAQFPVTYTNLITLFVGANPTFSVKASGASPLAYYWYTNGVVASGATNAAYALTNAQVTSPTSFTCIVSNSLGTATSMLWSVTYLAAPPAPYPQSVLSLKPIAYWRMSESDDSAGNQGAICQDFAGGNDGLYSNVILAQPGYNPIADPADTSAQFGYYSANNCYAGQIGTNIDFSAPSGSNAVFSVAAWVDGSSSSQRANAGIVTKGYFNGEEFTLDEGAPSANFRFEVRGANGTAYNANSTVNAFNSGWHFLVGVCDEASGNVSIYVDGILSGSASIPAGAGIINSVTAPVMIGARASTAASGGDNQFIGSINDVAIFASSGIIVGRD
jgi:hypothetical protein